MAINIIKKAAAPAPAPPTILVDVPVYRFGKSGVDGDATMKDELGGKGANLCGMLNLGIMVPPGFIIPTDISLMPETSELLQGLEKALAVGMGFIHYEKPESLVSVRSGARVSMPGMMDTILNIGMTRENMYEWADRIGVRAAYDSYRRLQQMYGSVVCGIPMESFEKELEEVKEAHGVKDDVDLTEAMLDRLIVGYECIYDKNNKVLPETLEGQLLGATLAVFKSWNNPRAKEYRKINKIPDSWGTAVTVQSMVFGNMNDNSATGVLFTRDPSTGEQTITGEFLINAQGEDVVAGIRTPEKLKGIYEWNFDLGVQLVAIAEKLEKHYKDMQDIEFTVENGDLYILQTRSGKRAAKAAFKIAHDLVQEGVITKEEAVTRVTSKQLKAALKVSIDPKFTKEPDLVGIAAGGSVVTGIAVFSSEDAINCKEPCILITKETTPDDIGGINASVGILTQTGGLTSHAAVVARGMNKACVVGATELTVTDHSCMYNGKGVLEGDTVTIDGSTGKTWFHVEVPIVQGGATREMVAVSSWALGVGDKPAQVYLDRDHSLEEMVAEISVHNGVVIVDAAPLFLSSGGHKAGSGYDDTPVVTLGKAMEQCPAVRLMMNFTGGMPSVYEEDRMFRDLVHRPVVATAAYNVVLSRISELWSQDTVDRVLVYGTELPKVVPYGIKQIKGVHTFDDLLSADSSISVAHEDVLTVFGSYMGLHTAMMLVSTAQGKGEKWLKVVEQTGYYWSDYLGEAQ